MIVGSADTARVSLIDGAGVGTAAKMAGGAGLYAIAAYLHILEEGLARGDRGLAVANVGVQIGGFGNRN